jgi:ATP-binding cassette subfamily F protein 3
LDLSVRDGECIAVVGRNGCGKSTLLRTIAGIEAPDKGEVRLPSRATIGYLPQEADLDVDHSLREELWNAFTEVRAALAEMATLEKQMAETDPDSPEHDRVMRRYGDVSHLVEHRDGYALDTQMEQVSHGLGFRGEDLSRSCKEFSGGWQMRILLAKLLLRKPDVLLLDEPTNHLDLETTLWLEDWIKNCGRTVMLVSHERATMDRLADRIVCIERGRAEVYPGDFSKYLELSEKKRDAEWAAYQQQRKELDAMEAFIRKFRANASRAAMVQSRVKQMAKIERLETPFHPTAIHFKFPEAPKSYSEVLSLDNLSHSYGKKRVLSNLNLKIMRGEKIGLVGVNGAGKSTLLRIMAGRETPTEGACVLGWKVQRTYFAQYDTSTLESNVTLLQAIEGTAPMGEAARSRNLLGAFLFSGDDAEKPLRALSGGERTRFRLAQILFSPANLLLLDEPTNHLDVTSRATVEEALRAYTGTVVVVSHDRVFMDRVTDKIVEIDQGKIRVYPGKYSDYLYYREQQLAEESGKEPPARHEESRPLTSKEERIRDREEKKIRDRKLRSLETKTKKVDQEIEQTEKRLAEIEQAIASPEVAADYSRLVPLTEEHGQLTKQHKDLLEEWERLHGELEGLEAGGGFVQS